MAKRVISKIIVHCADTPTGKDYGVLDIDEWHKERGFEPSSNGHYCGYHWVIRLDGTIEMGRLESDIGAHCQGDNAESIGVCLIGEGKYTPDQMASLYYILGQICNGYGLEAKQVFGHYEMRSGIKQGKSCPMMDMEKVRDSLELYLKGVRDGFFE